MKIKSKIPGAWEHAWNGKGTINYRIVNVPKRGIGETSVQKILQIARTQGVSAMTAVRDLLGLDVDVSELLPTDGAEFGFDNIATSLKTSPLLLERYLTAAQRISTLAIGAGSGNALGGALVMLAFGLGTQPGMIGAGLLAKKAVEKGLTRKPWVKTSLAPGSRLVTRYLTEAGLLPYLEKLGFALAGVPWAVEAASTTEFRERCRAGLKSMRDRETESEIARLERHIATLRARLTPNAPVRRRR